MNYMKTPFKNILLFFVVILTIAAVFSSYNLPRSQEEEVDIITFVNRLNEGAVKTVEIRGNSLTAELTDGKKIKTLKEEDDTFGDFIKNYNVSGEALKNTKIEVQKRGGAGYWAGIILPVLLPLLVIGTFIFIMMRQVQGANIRAMSFGQSGAREAPKDGKDKITFANVAGVREAKQELQEVVEFLRNPKKFGALGAKIPKGVLLMGSPGTGKTLLARATSGEADVPFFHISGSEFVEMFVGIGAARVRDLFAKAKKNAPCIIFIDEIDAVGRQRGAGLGGSHDEREQTLNQILVEMDGFDPNSGIIVMAATNRPDILDPALLRPGRFDRRVVLDEPDINDREEILKIHAKNKPLAAGVNLRKAAERTPGFSGADLANLLNEAAILAARRDKKEIGQEEIYESIEKVMLGPERKSRMMSEREKKITAYHEAGHALVAHALPDSDPVHKVSIVSRGHAGGYTLKLPTEDRRLRTKAEFLAELAVSLGGRVAEQEIFGSEQITTGASNDLKQATRLAKNVVVRYGMSEALGPRTFGDHEELIFLGREITEQRDYSDKTAEQIDSEISGLINNAGKTAERVIKEQKNKLDLIAATLLRKETLEREEFEALFT